MPTYYATGVSATLATCELQSSLSNVVDLKMGREQRTDAARIQDLFAKARRLPERPIGPVASENEVVQFIGANQDMPLYMVEAGDRASSVGIPAPSCLPEFSDGSPLTSLGAISTPTQPSFTHSPVKPSILESKTSVAAASTHDHTLGDALQAARTYLTDTSAAQALVLDLELSNKSFLQGIPTARSKMTAGKDLKIEVFVNGQLAEVSFVNCKRSAAQIERDHIRFGGTRVHRQAEKPWTYSKPEIADHELDEGAAERRWDAVSAELVQEAEGRGKDRFGHIPPSAQFLMAMSSLEISQRLHGRREIGLIDVVITAGRGRKYGPETEYVMGPIRMYDPAYTIATHDTIEPPSSSIGDNINVGIPGVQQSSPEVPLKRLGWAAPAITTPSPPKKTHAEFMKDLGVDGDPKKIFVGDYENKKGKTGKVGRTLGQRLGDLKKMSPRNQAKELEDLRERLGLSPTKKSGAVEPARKKSKLDHNLENDPFSDPGLNPFANAVGVPEGTMNPRDMLKRSRTMPEGDERDVALAELAGTRIDMALSAGSSPDGHLVRRIASESPHRTPIRMTKASALANSPTSVPVKVPRQQTAVRTPQRRSKQETCTIPNGDEDMLLLPTTPTSKRKNTDGTPTRSGRGANRTSHKWIPGEPTAAETLKSFKSGDASQGSCIGYAKDEEVFRQIRKERSGEFKEECLLVGMRFVVF